MMSFNIDQVSFRDLYRQVIFVDYSLREPLAAAGVTDLPEDADGMLAYGYIDPDAGLSFEALAPARMSDLAVYPDFDLRRKLKCSVKVRGAEMSVHTTVAYSKNLEEYRETYADHIASIDEFYAVSPDREVTRKDTAIDHLRHPCYPDDIRISIVDEDYGEERLWATLQGCTEDGLYYVGKLLNEPGQNFGVHAGDLVALVPDRGADGMGELAFLTTPKLKLEPEDDEEDPDDEAFEVKFAVACEVMRRADLLDLGTNEKHAAPADEYDFEAFVAADCISADSDVEQAAAVIAKIIGTSFDVECDALECEEVAEELLAAWDEAGVEPDDVDYDPMPLVDEHFSRWDEEKARWDEEASAAADADDEPGDAGVTYHFIVRTCSQDWDDEDVDEYEDADEHEGAGEGGAAGEGEE